MMASFILVRCLTLLLLMLSAVIASPITKSSRAVIPRQSNNTTITTDGVINWLSNWVDTKMSGVDYSTVTFQDAFVDSISYLWPDILPGESINFHCSFKHPCSAGLEPVSTDLDAQYAWNILRAMENMQDFYKTAWDMLGDAHSDFASSYSGQIYNILKNDGEGFKHGAVLPPVWDGVKQTLRMISTYNKELYELGTVSLKAIGDIIPAIDIIKDLVTIFDSSLIIPADVPDANLLESFAQMILSQQDVMEHTFLSSMNQNPSNPTGIVNILKAQPDAFIGSSESLDDNTLTNMKAEYLHILSVAFINTYYSSTGQVFGLISDTDDWDDSSDCDGSGSFNYPICINDPQNPIGGFGLAFAPRPTQLKVSAYKAVEGPQFVYLNDATFSRAPYNFNAEEALLGSLKCQQSRNLSSKFNAEYFQNMNDQVQQDRNSYSPNLNAVHDQGSADKAAGLLLYTSSMDPNDDCFWAVPVITDLYDIHSAANSPGAAELINIVNNYEAYIDGWSDS